jgi:hypothetical protein
MGAGHSSVIAAELPPAAATGGSRRNKVLAAHGVTETGSRRGGSSNARPPTAGPAKPAK